MQDSLSVGRQTYAGLFLVTMALLMHEILLTRVFSVTMYYHFAFVAVSLAMFGLTAGAIIVHTHPEYFTTARAKYHLTTTTLLLALSIPLAFLIHLSLPFVLNFSPVGMFAIAFNYCVISVPYVCGGICVCLALTKFPRQVGKLYAADLAGAACGCLLLILLLAITDGPTAIILVAATASLGAYLFALDGNLPKRRRQALQLLTLLLTIAATNSIWISQNGISFLRPIWVKGAVEEPPLYEKWNSFSRIIVFGDPDELVAPAGWNISETYQSPARIRQLRINIDANAGTMLTAFSGDPGELDFLKYDLTNLAHYLRQNADVCIIGVGGGRDILSALAFRQKSVVGIEINPDICRTVNQRYGDFTGHLDRHPAVTFVNDEARSYLTRQDRKFDIIESSFIDSWAATAAGAFVLTENSLYTVEAWKIFLDKLNADGILTFTRWYDETAPYEIYRLTSLARAALLESGVRDPRGHMLIVRKETGATMLVGKAPFTDRDLVVLEQVCQRMNFQIILSPREAGDVVLATIASGQDLTRFYEEFPANLTPPRDDSPFFFNMARFRDILKPFGNDEVMHNLHGVTYALLGFLLVIVTSLSLFCIVIPSMTKSAPSLSRNTWPLLLFFSAIGLGFMFIEISLMQRLIVFLGHPTYALSVVLFSLLLSSGLGSILAPRTTMNPARRLDLICLTALCLTLAVFGLTMTSIIHSFQAAPNLVRILVSLVIIFPMGVFMGMAFPLGMQKISPTTVALAPWLWGVNGAMSICASVVAVIISIAVGISATFWTGCICYAAALVGYFWVDRNSRAMAKPESAPGAAPTGL